MADAQLVLLTHASNDLTVLHHALAQLPASLRAVEGVNLQAVTDMDAVLAGPVSTARIVILRVLGRLGSIPGVADLVAHARRHGIHLIAISGTGELEPELAAISTVTPSVLSHCLEYFQAGGSTNLAQLLRYLSDHLLMTGFGYEPAQRLPEHGIYHPDLAPDASTADWLALCDPIKPSVGIVFYRAHWMSGNTRFIDAMLDALEQRGMNVLPVFTASLRSGDGDLPTALQYFRAGATTCIDVLINTTSFAMGEITAGGATPAGWSVNVLETLDVPVLQAITSGMTFAQWEQSARGLNPLDAAMNVVLPEFDGRIITVPVSFKARAAGMPSEVIAYEPVMERVARVAGIAARCARL